MHCGIEWCSLCECVCIEDKLKLKPLVQSPPCDSKITTQHQRIKVKLKWTTINEELKELKRTKSSLSVSGNLESPMQIWSTVKTENTILKQSNADPTSKFTLAKASECVCSIQQIEIDFKTKQEILT